MTSTPVVRTYDPMTDQPPTVEGMALAAPDGVYGEATLRIHATVEGDVTDFEGTTAIYTDGEVEVRNGHICRWTQHEFNSGIQSYARPVVLANWAQEAAERLFPLP